MRRRSFLKGPLLASSASAMFAQTNAGRGSSETVQLESRDLRLTYDLANGGCGLYFANGAPLLLNTTAVLFPRGMALVSDSNYSRRAHRSKLSDPGVQGEQLTIQCTDRTGALNLEHRVTLLDGKPGVVFELVFTNTSAKDLWVRYSEPLRALLDERSGCYLGGEGLGSRVRKVLTNGFMCYDPGELIDFAWMPGRDFVSWWNAAFHCPDTKQTLVVGYLENTGASGQITARAERSRNWEPATTGFDLRAQSFYNRYFLLKPGASRSSGRVLFLLDSNPFDALEGFADRYAQLQRVKLNPIVNGWCSWFYTRRVATEDEQLKNAEFVARNLKQYGMEWIQLDAGYQRAFGDWQANDQYPHGMKWMAGRIRELGLKPGIWVAPFEVSQGTEVATGHPEWLVHDSGGNLVKWRDNYATWIQGDHYTLDVTHPGARQWLFDLFKMMADDWGYDMIKIDRMEWTLLGAERYFDPTISKAQAYRMGMETIRKAIGPGRHLLDCGPAQNNVGIVDSVRIEEDGPPLNWRQYAKRPNSVAPAAAHRYYFHNRTWINDDDHLGIAQMPIPQGRAAATAVALSGGTMILGDRLIQLDAERLELLKKVIPSYGEAGRPIDLFEKEYPEIFSLKIHKDFGEWWIAASFNWSEEGSAIREFDLTRLGAEPSKSYLVYDFWEQRLLGTYRAKVPLVLEPSSVCLMMIREALHHPQVISTTRHFTQGAVELKDVRWDAANLTLSGTGMGGPGTKWEVCVYVPPGFTWEGKGAAFFQWKDSDHVLAVAYQTDPHIIRGQLDFSQSASVPWRFRFEQS